MKYENPEMQLILKQYQYIRILEEQLDVCKEQLKAQELLIEEQNKALALFAEASRLLSAWTVSRLKKQSGRALY